MTEQLRLHTSHRIAAQDPGDYAWRADADLRERHAFPPSEDGRVPARALCGVRWTAAFGRHGASTCQGCLAKLRDQLRATTVALSAVGVRIDLPRGEEDADHRGDHFAGMPR